MSGKQVHAIGKGDTRTPLGRILTYKDRTPIDLTGLTVKVFGEDDLSVAWITETTTGVTAHPTVAFTTNTADGFDRLRNNDSKAKNGMQVVVSNSGGALPTGLAASTRYFVVEADPNGFKVSITPNGPAIDITDAGTGTHSYYIVGSVQYDFQAADVDTAGTYWLWFRVYSGTEPDTIPVDENDVKVRLLEIRIQEPQ